MGWFVTQQQIKETVIQKAKDITGAIRISFQVILNTRYFG